MPSDSICWVSLSLFSIFTSSQHLDVRLQVQALRAEARSHMTECCRSNSRTGTRAGTPERRSRQPSSFKSQLKCHLYSSLNALERSNLPSLFSLFFSFVLCTLSRPLLYIYYYIETICSFACLPGSVDSPASMKNYLIQTS